MSKKRSFTISYLEVVCIKRKFGWWKRLLGCEEIITDIQTRKAKVKCTPEEAEAFARILGQTSPHASLVQIEEAGEATSYIETTEDDA